MIQVQGEKGEDKGKEEMRWGEWERIVRSGHGEDRRAEETRNRKEVGRTKHKKGGWRGDGIKELLEEGDGRDRGRERIRNVQSGSHDVQAPIVQKMDITIQWISIGKTNCAFQWIEFYPVDSVIHLLNNWGQES